MSETPRLRAATTLRADDGWTYGVSVGDSVYHQLDPNPMNVTLRRVTETDGERLVVMSSGGLDGLVFHRGPSDVEGFPNDELRHNPWERVWPVNMTNMEIVARLEQEVRSKVDSSSSEVCRRMTGTIEELIKTLPVSEETLRSILLLLVADMDERL